MGWFEELMGRRPGGDGDYTPLSALAHPDDYSDLAEQARAVATDRLREMQRPKGGRKSMPSLADIRAAEAAYQRELSGEPDPYGAARISTPPLPARWG
jgi:hypothetical protein